MRRYLLTLAAILVLLTGCGDDSDASEDRTPAQIESTQAACATEANVLQAAGAAWATTGAEEPPTPTDLLGAGYLDAEPRYYDIDGWVDYELTLTLTAEGEAAGCPADPS